MTADPPPRKSKPVADKAAEREAKLGEALRANLRRRKAEAKPRPAKPAGGDSA